MTAAEQELRRQLKREYKALQRAGLPAYAGLVDSCPKRWGYMRRLDSAGRVVALFSRDRAGRLGDIDRALKGAA